MPNERPWTRDEAGLVWVRLYRKGREKGGWVYLDADLLESCGMPTDVPLMVKRFPLRPTARGRAQGEMSAERRRGRIILNLSIVTETKEAEEFLTRRMPRWKVPSTSSP